MKQRENGIAYLLLAPFLIVFIVFLGYPVFYSFLLSFYKTTIYTDWYNVFGDMNYAGLENYYQLLFEDEQFLWSIVLTLYYAVLTIPATIIVSLTLALLLDNNLKGKGFFRAAFFLPNILDTLVVGSIWLYIFAPQIGLFDNLLSPLGITFFQKGLLNSAKTALPTIAFVMVLKSAGFGMILFLISLQRIPKSLYEAAELDGAKSWQKFYYLTFPFLKPVIFFLCITGTMAVLNAFSEIYAMTNATAGPSQEIFGQTVNAAKISGYYLFQKFEQGQYGYAAAISYILFLIALLISWGNAKLLGGENES